ncbi:MAG: VOC family protein [Ancrocorticia sp.]
MTSQDTRTAQADKLSASTYMGAVVLDVRNLANMTMFYHSVIGLDVLHEKGGQVILGRSAKEPLQGQDPHGTHGTPAPWLNRTGHVGTSPTTSLTTPPSRAVSTAGTPLAGELAVVVLRENTSLPLRPEGSAGLFHTAILFQNPRELAAAIIRIARHTPQLFTGTGDHHVSQAFYLDDPEGNGVELYIDRPRDRWQWRNDQIHMTTEYIDPNRFITENMPGVSEQAREGGNNVTLGHVHLQVGDVRSAHKFYVETLGFETTARMGNSALFVSAGGYHHHMAMNTWGSGGTGLRVPSLGLGRVDILVPERSETEAAAARLAHAGFTVRDDGRTIETNDPWGNLVRLTAE